jgi:HlyD family secretion protein
MNQQTKINDPVDATLAETSDPASAKARDLVPVRSDRALPAPLAGAKRIYGRGWWLRAVLVLTLLGGGAGAFYWWHRLHLPLPSAIVFGNGRLEADEINIDTKYAARIAEILADEGDVVKAGQVVARMDTRDLTASLKKAEAQVSQVRRAVDEANANVDQQRSQMLLAQQEFDRATCLVQKGFQTKEIMDQRQQQLDGANAGLSAANLRVIEFQHALDAATHEVELYSVQIADDTLVAPRDGRIQYRIANIGEVLPAGGHVFAMLDTSYVYMDVYLPTEAAGKVKYGADARVTVDAYPKVAIPARTRRNLFASRPHLRGRTYVSYRSVDPDAAFPARIRPVVRVRIPACILFRVSARCGRGLPGDDRADEAGLLRPYGESGC